MIKFVLVAALLGMATSNPESGEERGKRAVSNVNVNVLVNGPSGQDPCGDNG